MTKARLGLMPWISGSWCMQPHEALFLSLMVINCSAEVSMDRIRIGYPAGYLRFFRIRIGFGYSFLKTNGSGSGYWFDFYNEIFLRGIQDVRNDGGSVFFAMVFILTTCVALIRTNGNSCYFIVNFFRPSGSSKLLLYC